MHYNYDAESQTFEVTDYIDPNECDILDLQQLYAETNRKILILQIRLAKFNKLDNVPTVIIDKTKEELRHTEFVRDRVVNFIIERKTEESPEAKLMKAIFVEGPKKNGKQDEKRRK